MWKVIIYLVFFTCIFMILNTSTDIFALDGSGLFSVFECIIAAAIISAIQMLPIILISRSIKAGKKHAKKEAMSEIDFSRDKGWFRDILNEYSPAQLSYVDDFEIESYENISAMLLSLKLKNKIDIIDGKIKVLGDDSGLKSSESYILRNIKDGKVKLLSDGYLKSLAKEECRNAGLIQEERNKVEKIKNKIFKGALGIFFMVLALQLINFIGLFLPEDSVITMLLVIIAVTIIPIVAISRIGRIPYLISYSISKIGAYERTQKGEEINKKIEGLKHYIQEYTSLNNKKQNELVLWEEYLIYSVLFGINKKLIKELSEVIEIK